MISSLAGAGIGGFAGAHMGGARGIAIGAAAGSAAGYMMGPREDRFGGTSFIGAAAIGAAAYRYGGPLSRHGLRGVAGVARSDYRYVRDNAGKWAGQARAWWGGTRSPVAGTAGSAVVNPRGAAGADIPVGGQLRGRPISAKSLSNFRRSFGRELRRDAALPNSKVPRGIPVATRVREARLRQVSGKFLPSIRGMALRREVPILRVADAHRLRRTNPLLRSVRPPPLRPAGSVSKSVSKFRSMKRAFTGRNRRAAIAGAFRGLWGLRG